MENLVLSFLSRDWAGLPVAAVVALLGGWCLRCRPGGRRDVGGGSAGARAAGPRGAPGARVWHLVHVARVRAAYPPPGRLVDVGGYRLHVVAEGESGGTPSVVWMAGGHVGGFAIHHLHGSFGRRRARSSSTVRAPAGATSARSRARRPAKRMRSSLPSMPPARRARSSSSAIPSAASSSRTWRGATRSAWPASSSSTRRPPTRSSTGRRSRRLPDAVRRGPERTAAPLRDPRRLRREGWDAPPVFKKVLDLVEERLGEAAAGDAGDRLRHEVRLHERVDLLRADARRSRRGRVGHGGLRRRPRGSAGGPREPGRDGGAGAPDYVVKTIATRVRAVRSTGTGCAGSTRARWERTSDARAGRSGPSRRTERGTTFPTSTPELIAGIVRRLLRPVLRHPPLLRTPEGPKGPPRELRAAFRRSRGSRGTPLALPLPRASVDGGARGRAPRTRSSSASRPPITSAGMPYGGRPPRRGRGDSRRRARGRGPGHARAPPSRAREHPHPLTRSGRT